jgi:hypothetical protein
MGVRRLGVGGRMWLYVTPCCLSALGHGLDIRKVEASKRFPSRLGFVQITPDLSQERQTGQNTNLLFGFLVEAVLLRRD